MSITFRNAPLQELIVELKWAVPGMPGPEAGQPNMPIFGFMNSTAFEEFYMRFGARVHAHGMTFAERLIPPNFPAPAFQVVYRYKNPEKPNEILQVGPGVFSANALKPYQSWKVFRPCVENGITALLDARPDKDKVIPFSNLSLRYINAFSTDLIGERDTATFIEDVLGFRATVPAPVRHFVPEGTRPTPSLAFAFDLKTKHRVQIALGEGVVNGSPSVMLDMNASTVGEIPSEKDAILGVLDEFRNVLHDIFVGGTAPLKAKMEPEEPNA